MYVECTVRKVRTSKWEHHRDYLINMNFYDQIAYNLVVFLFFRAFSSTCYIHLLCKICKRLLACRQSNIDPNSKHSTTNKMSTSSIQIPRFKMIFLVEFLLPFALALYFASPSSTRRIAFSMFKGRILHCILENKNKNIRTLFHSTNNGLNHLTAKYN